MEVQSMETNELREELEELMEEGAPESLDRVCDIAAELQHRDEPIIPPGDPNPAPFGIPKPDKLRIGFTWDDAMYGRDRAAAERAFWILERAGRNPSFHQADDGTCWIKFRG